MLCSFVDMIPVWATSVNHYNMSLFLSGSIQNNGWYVPYNWLKLSRSSLP